MKSLLLILLVLFNASAWACRPAPLPICKTRDLKLNRVELLKLEKLIDNYQTYLTKNLVIPETGGGSCFNNHFGAHYLRTLIQLLNKKSESCSSQVEKVRLSLQGLINPKSPENQAVPPGKHRKYLEALGKTIESTLNKTLT